MLENCNNMAEVKKLKYNLLEKIYNDVSDQKFNFNGIFIKVIKVRTSLSNFFELDIRAN